MQLQVVLQLALLSISSIASTANPQFDEPIDQTNNGTLDDNGFGFVRRPFFNSSRYYGDHDNTADTSDRSRYYRTGVSKISMEDFGHNMKIATTTTTAFTPLATDLRTNFFSFFTSPRSTSSVSTTTASTTSPTSTTTSTTTSITSTETSTTSSTTIPTTTISDPSPMNTTMLLSIPNFIGSEHHNISTTTEIAIKSNSEFDSICSGSKKWKLETLILLTTLLIWINLA